MVSTVHEIVCIGCPLACCIKVTVDEAGEIVELSGYQRKVGKKYSEQEYRSPERVLTSTVRTECSFMPLLPVRSNRPVPRDMLKDCVLALASVRVRPGLSLYSVIVPNILGTGADVVSTRDLVV